MRSCCETGSNLVRIIERDGEATVYECRVCGAKHYKVLAERGNFAGKGGIVGG